MPTSSHTTGSMLNGSMWASTPTRNYGKGTDYNKYGQMISAPTSSIARLLNTVGADIIRPSFLLVHLSTPTRNYGKGTDCHGRKSALAMTGGAFGGQMISAPTSFSRVFVLHRRGGYHPPAVSLGAPIDPLREITTRGRIATGALRPRNDRGSLWREKNASPSGEVDRRKARRKG